MSPEEHKQKHIELHRALDELFADYILHNPNNISYIRLPIGDLLQWAYEQTLNPTDDEAGTI
jgi:hypothetical protein